MYISFKVLTEENASDILSELREKTGGSEETEEIVNELLEGLDDGCEYAVSFHSGCVLLRIYDGEYLFPYPIAVLDGASELSAVEELCRYAVKEEIPLVICDLPRDAISDILPLFRHASIDAADVEGDYYTLRPISELSLTDGIPTEKTEELELTPLRTEDEREYAALCRDRDTNKYWGYDFREDVPDCEDSYFLESAENEYQRGVAVSFAVRYEGRFIGEAILYSFDLHGGAQSAVRIIPEYRRKGLATGALALLSKIASRMGLIRMLATVDSENEASCRMCDSFFDGFSKEGKNNLYTKKL